MNGDESTILKSLTKLSYGLYIVTSFMDNKLNGQISNTVFQVTDQPNRIVTCVSKKNLTHEYISKSGVFAVSVLDQSAPMTFIGLFGFKSGRDTDKLSQVNYKKGTTGCPCVIDYSIALLEAKVIDKVDAGTHTLFIGEVVSGKTLSDREPMTYAYYHHIKKGKTAKNAPTYRAQEHILKENKNKRSNKKMGKYVCDVCGYVYDPAEGDPDNGIKPGTSFEDLPDDWVCPVCGASKDQFSPEE